ncbi:MAG: helix-turn-helix domain-containing protein [Chloroflexi bacterium]|nr:helix-turn-helix domain-containing protein [Chloroflexota bacterium]
MSDISLPYGIDAAGRYVHISQVNRGTTDLRCPYCEGLLTARKGRQLAHHFAHTVETCLGVSSREFDDLMVPHYDRFNLYIDARAWGELQAWHDTDGRDGIPRILMDHDPQLLMEGYGRRAYQLTHEGKIPFGEATLSKFAEFQNDSVHTRHRNLSETVSRAYDGYGRVAQPVMSAYHQALVDLNIYRAQVARLFGLHLYLLEITHDAGVLYKIGVTARETDVRIAEIRRDLAPFFNFTELKVDRLCKNRGAVERYALHRYREYSTGVGDLTEYFMFDKQTLRNVRRDFTALGDLHYEKDDHLFSSTRLKGRYTISGLIAEILAGESSYIEVVTRRDILQKRHAEATKAGMEEAKQRGIHVGRPAESDREVLDKYPEIVEALSMGQAIKQIAREHNISRNTVRKVRDAMK